MATKFQGTGDRVPHGSVDQVAGRLPTNVGYELSRGAFPWESANAFLYAPDSDSSFPLFIQEYETSFVLSGSTGQSQLVRTFYPHNFQQPSFTISFQSPNQSYYNQLGEFIRLTQRKAISTGKPSRLEVPDGGAPAKNLRGLNRGFIAEGYVDRGERGGETGQFSPEGSFNFIVSNMLSGLYTETPTVIRQLASWADILKNNPGETFVTNPDHPVTPPTMQTPNHMGSPLGLPGVKGN